MDKRKPISWRTFPDFFHGRKLEGCGSSSFHSSVDPQCFITYEPCFKEAPFAELLFQGGNFLLCMNGSDVNLRVNVKFRIYDGFLNFYSILFFAVREKALDYYGIGI